LLALVAKARDKLLLVVLAEGSVLGVELLMDLPGVEWISL
jgi:hypothetical protein